jgi:hypothetical protein
MHPLTLSSIRGTFYINCGRPTLDILENKVLIFGHFKGVREIVTSLPI